MADGDAPPVVTGEVPPAGGNTPPVVTTPPAPASVSADPPAGQIPQGVFDRIDRLTRDKKTAEERAVALEAELARVRANGGTPPAQPSGTPPAPPAPRAAPMPVDEIERRANELAQQRSFTDKCNSIAQKGQGAHADFQGTIGQLGSMGALNPVIIDAAVETAGNDAHELLYALGKDLNEATRIANLPPISQALALSKFNTDRLAKASKSVSNAPPPPSSSVGGGPPAQTDEPQASDDSATWYRKREKQLGYSSGNY